MKEYVYFDRQLVNSTLAQIDEGILTKLISGQTTTKPNQIKKTVARRYRVVETEKLV